MMPAGNWEELVLESVLHHRDIQDNKIEVLKVAPKAVMVMFVLPFSVSVW